jgi:signal transduction histidine kinase
MGRAGKTSGAALPGDNDGGMDRAVATSRPQEIDSHRLAVERAALRRIGALAVRPASPWQVFGAIVEELGRLMPVDHVRMWRFEGDTATAVASAGALDDAMPVGLRESLDRDSLAARVHRTGRSQRVDDYAAVGGDFAARAIAVGAGSAAAIPIVVDGRRWGALVAVDRAPRRLPHDAEACMDDFAALTAPAIANAESRTRADRLADEQAALRRVARLVSQDAPPGAIYEAVAAEMSALLGAERVVLARFGRGDDVMAIADDGRSGPLPPSDADLPASIARQLEPCGVRVAVGAPVFVDGEPWGLAMAGWTPDKPPAAGAEERIAGMAEIFAAAIAGADVRDRVAAAGERLRSEEARARRHVLRDLHDGAQQRLVHTIVTLQLARSALDAGDERAAALVEEALEHAEASHAELRDLVHGTLPGPLAGGGLQGGIAALAARLDLPVDLDVRAGRLPAEVEAAAYFVVAEALTNVVKHAQATSAEVTAFVHDRSLHLHVRDDGVGGAHAAGHGLAGMDDRVAALGGQLTIESPTGGGTLVAAMLPVGPRSGDRRRRSGGDPAAAVGQPGPTGHRTRVSAV